MKISFDSGNSGKTRISRVKSPCKAFNNPFASPFDIGQVLYVVMPYWGFGTFSGGTFGQDSSNGNFPQISATFNDSWPTIYSTATINVSVTNGTSFTWNHTSTSTCSPYLLTAEQAAAIGSNAGALQFVNTLGAQPSTPIVAVAATGEATITATSISFPIAVEVETTGSNPQGTMTVTLSNPAAFPSAACISGMTALTASVYKQITGQTFAPVPNTGQGNAYFSVDENNNLIWMTAGNDELMGTMQGIITAVNAAPYRAGNSTFLIPYYGDVNGENDPAFASFARTDLIRPPSGVSFEPTFQQTGGDGVTSIAGGASGAAIYGACASAKSVYWLSGQNGFNHNVSGFAKPNKIVYGMNITSIPGNAPPPINASPSIGQGAQVVKQFPSFPRTVYFGPEYGLFPAQGERWGFNPTVVGY